MIRIKRAGAEKRREQGAGPESGGAWEPGAAPESDAVLEWKEVTVKTGTAADEVSVPYLSFPLLERTGLVRHGFSTKLGGVSKGEFATMNFGVSRGDEPACVLENFRRMGQALGVKPEQMVLSFQTHTVNIRRVTAKDGGKGVVRERGYTDVDGLITDEPGLCLVTLYADCVPLYFLDPVKRAIGLSHSGWKGTVAQMGRKTVEEMGKAFGSDPADILACIGPSICKDCYEVGPEVAEAFQKAFAPEQAAEMLLAKDNGKYQLDLWEANRQILLEAGIRPEHLSVTDICTMCNSQWLFSHRATGGRRGNLGAFLCIRDE